MERDFALTMPAVTLFSKPNGEPIAITHSPGRSFDGSPMLHGRQVLRLDLQHRDVGALVGADDLRGVLAPVGQSCTVTSSASATTCALVRM